MEAKKSLPAIEKETISKKENSGKAKLEKVRHEHIIYIKKKTKAQRKSVKEKNMSESTFR